MEVIIFISNSMVCQVFNVGVVPNKYHQSLLHNGFEKK